MEKPKLFIVIYRCNQVGEYLSAQRTFTSYSDAEEMLALYKRAPAPCCDDFQIAEVVRHGVN